MVQSSLTLMNNNKIVSLNTGVTIELGNKSINKQIIAIIIVIDNQNYTLKRMNKWLFQQVRDVILGRQLSFSRKKKSTK